MAPRVAEAVAVRRKRQAETTLASKRQLPTAWAVPKAVLNLAVLGVLLAAWFSGRALLRPRLPPEITPLKAPKMKDLPEFDTQYKSDMLWGSYRSGLYFGMRTRTPRPLLTGLMWFDPDSLDTVRNRRVRHEADQGDGLQSYGWVRHDGRTYGRQQLVDGPYDITLNMVKHSSEGSAFGGDWAVRVSVAKTAGWVGPPPEPQHPPKPKRKRVSLLFYIADAHWRDAELALLPSGTPPKSRLLQGQTITLASGDNEDIGPWSMLLRPGDAAPGVASKTACTLRHLGIRLGDGQQLVELKGLALQALLEHARRHGWERGVKLQLPDIEQPHSNLAVFQVTTTLPASFDVVFVSGAGSVASNAAAEDPDAEEEEEDAGDDEEEAGGEGRRGGGGWRDRGAAAAEPRLAALTGDPLGALIASREAAFEARFADVFPLAALGGGDSGPTAAQVGEAAKAALSNLVGSMGYFHGASHIQLPPGRRAPAGLALREYSRPGSGGDDGLGDVVEYWRDALFTAVPSRSFFPRGFLWDEGFHQLLLQRWDPQLSRDALAHWLDLMNTQGWIPREQILGKEARKRVPTDFILQHPSHANPPSLFLPLQAMAEAVRAATGHGGAAASSGGLMLKAQEAQRAHDFLSRAWPRLEAWYGWFNRSQAGQLPGSYYWHGRDGATDRELNPKTLMSGLDDYPRASHPTGDERHVDLLAWMVFASRAMAVIGRAAGRGDGVAARYAAAADALGALPRLLSLHYDEASQQFADWGLHSEAVRLEQRSTVVDGRSQTYHVRVVLEEPSRRFVPAFGYVSLFPLCMQLLPPDSPQLGRQLQLLRDEALLWTPQGLRSLAPTSSVYKKYNTQHDAPYWRGPIWVNINFMVLRALYRYSRASGPHMETAGQLYAELRTSLASNLVTQYGGSGYLWEQYDDGDGRGMSSHPFTGWTALLTLIVAEAY